MVITEIAKKNLAKILTISARDYCEMKGLDLGCYKAIGVHVRGTHEEFAQIMPDEAEVVVDYQCAGSHYGMYSSGTALIRKE